MFLFTYRNWANIWLIFQDTASHSSSKAKTLVKLVWKPTALNGTTVVQVHWEKEEQKNSYTLILYFDNFLKSCESKYKYKTKIVFLKLT